MSPALSPDADAGPAGLRADARRNHERIMAAAISLFAEKGVEATVPEIAARAGVGNATVYRSFPAKADLVEAVARHQLAWFADRVQTAAEQDDAFAALHDLIRDISEKLAGDRFLVEILPQAKRWREENGLTARLSEIIARAQRQGRLRPDATTQDIQVLVGGYSRVLIELDIRDPAQWGRYATLVLNALRP